MGNANAAHGQYLPRRVTKLKKPRSVKIIGEFRALMCNRDSPAVHFPDALDAVTSLRDRFSSFASLRSSAHGAVQSSSLECGTARRRCNRLCRE